MVARQIATFVGMAERRKLTARMLRKQRKAAKPAQLASISVEHLCIVARDAPTEVSRSRETELVMRM